MNPSSHDHDEGLIRAIGVRALALNIINMVVGAGIFVLPGLVAAQLGPAAIVAYLICSIAVALVFLCFAEVGSRITRSGGAYAYIEEAFGPFAGFMASILLWFGWSVLSDAATVVATVEVMAFAFPDLARPLPRAVFIVALLALMAVVNITGVRSGVRLVAVSTVVKIIPLCLLLVAGMFALEVENLAITAWPSPQAAGAGALLLFFAFAGAESALSSSGEIKDSRTTVPVGVLLGLTAVLVLYVGLQVVAQGVLGAELANETEAPLAAAAEKVFGGWGGKMLLVAAVISIYASVSGDMLNTPRVLFAAARDGNLPKFLARVHPRFKTPYASIIAFASMICAVALTGTFKSLAIVASGSILVVYLGVSLATIRFRIRDGAPNAREFSIPGGVIVPVLSCLIIGWLLLRLTPQEARGLALLCGASVAAYAARSYFFARADAP